MKIICEIRTVLRTLKRMLWFGDDFVVYDGHNFKEMNDGDIICTTCGKRMD